MPVVKRNPSVERSEGSGFATGYRFDSITSKGSSALNEDALAVNERTGIFAVFDGASSLTSFSDSKGRTGGFLAANIAREVFENEDKELVDLVRETNSRIRKAMLDAGINASDKLNLWVTAAAAIKIGKDSFDWIQVSDTLILVLYKDGRHKLLVNDYDHDQGVLTLMAQLARDGVEDPRAAITKPLERLRRQLNVTYGFIAGESSVRFLKSGTESLKGVEEIILFSDGLLIPKAVPKEPDDIDTLVKEYRKGGLRGWLGYVRNLALSDPKMLKYPRFKPYDDATAISVSFTGAGSKRS